MLALYSAALAVPDDERDAWLAGACKDPETRAELESLLAADAPDATIFENSPAAMPAMKQLGGDLIGQRLGEFQVLQQIGSGGMGAVYLAERVDGDFDQQVAIKVVQSGFVSEQGLRRFMRERQILGRLHHRHICKILGGGLCADGRPYLVMPFLEGAQPLDEYCTRLNMPLKARLQLFLGVCDAVQHAHQNLVVHSDLKPPNILVDTEGEVQLLDFGIARLLDVGQQGQTTQLEGQRPLTPQFASPEQIEGQAPSTLSDIYSLGVVLYGLIAREMPYRFDKRRLDDISAHLATTDPLPPSKHRREIPSDLDNIVLKAMAREPERRYFSAAALAEDLRRWLAGQPVQARPATLGYQLGKFVRRHQWPVSMAALGLIALIGLATVLLISNRQISAQAVQLEIEKDRAEATALFWSDLFEQTNPVHANQAPTSTKELLDRAVVQLRDAENLGRQTRARLLSVISSAYWNLAENETALKVAEQAVGLYVASDLPSDAEAIANLQLANIGMALGQLDVAQNAAQRSLDILDGMPEPDQKTRANAFNALALVFGERGESVKAAEALEKAIALQALLVGPGIQVERATAMSNLGYVYFQMSTTPGPQSASYQARASELVAEASQILLEELGPEHPRVSFMINAAGVLSRGRGDYEQALEYFTQASEIANKALPAEHDFHYTLSYNSGHVLLLLGRPERASETFSAAMESASLTLPLGHPDRMSLLRGSGHAAALLDDRDGEQRALEQLRAELSATETADPLSSLWARALDLDLRRPLDVQAMPELMALREAAAGHEAPDLIDFVEGINSPADTLGE